MRLSASGSSIVGMHGSLLKQCVLLSLTLFHFAAYSQTSESQSDSKGDSKVIYLVITPTSCALCYEKLLLSIENVNHLAAVVPVILAPADPAIVSLLIAREAKHTLFEPKSFIVSSADALGLSDLKGPIHASPFLVLKKGDKTKVLSYRYLHSEATTVMAISRRMIRFLK
jgi:hypothetical protein